MSALDSTFFYGSGKDKELYHLIRAVRDNVISHKRELDINGNADRGYIGNTLGIVETLKTLGINAAVRTDDLEKWLWKGILWEEAKKEVR